MDEPAPTTLRRAGPADAAAVRALTRTAYAKWVALLGREPLPMTADYDRVVVAHRIDLVEREGALQALVETDLRADDLLVVNLAVHPDHQGKRLGIALLAHAEALARKAGRNTVRLYTNELMAGNVDFYRRQGYRIESIAPYELGRVVNLIKHLGP